MAKLPSLPITLVLSSGALTLICCLILLASTRSIQAITSSQLDSHSDGELVPSSQLADNINGLVGQLSPYKNNEDPLSKRLESITSSVSSIDSSIGINTTENNDQATVTTTTTTTTTTSSPPILSVFGASISTEANGQPVTRANRKRFRQRERGSRQYGGANSQDSYASAYQAVSSADHSAYSYPSPSSKSLYNNHNHNQNHQHQQSDDDYSSNPLTSYMSTGSSYSGTGNSRNNHHLSSDHPSSEYSDMQPPSTSALYSSSGLSPNLSGGTYLGTSSGHLSSSSSPTNLGYFQTTQQTAPIYSGAALGPDMHRYYSSSAAPSFPSVASGPSHHSTTNSGFFGGMDRSSFLNSFGSPLASASHVASSALSNWTHGLSLTEIACLVLAVGVGAIVLGGPFFLIYLALINTYSSTGTVSLTGSTGTTSSTTVNGRKQRNGSTQMALSQVLFDKLSPWVDSEQVLSTFKSLMKSINNYANIDNNNYNNAPSSWDGKSAGSASGPQSLKTNKKD